MDGGVMILWLQYLRQLEMACAKAAALPDAAADAKTISEDEEWGGESEAMAAEPRTPSSTESRAPSGGSPAESPPRLRLNTRLATDPARAPSATSLKFEAPSPLKLEPPSPPAAPLPPPLPLINVPPYICAPCGIRYSSLSTLQAHRDHYCSNRRAKPPEPSDSPPDQAAEERPSSKQYACTQCSYSADKKVSLNRHMRMHSSSPGAASTPNGDSNDGPPAPDRYCTECDIRFSSVKTFRAHKAHYCSTRQVVKPARGGSSAGSAPTSPRTTPPSAPLALALPTDPILVVPYSLLRGASALPGASLPDPEAPCFLLPNGTFQPLGRALPAPDRDNDVLKAVNRPRDTATPLDLSVRRSPGAPAEDEKENRRGATPEQIVCAPSLPGSPATPSPRRSCSPAPSPKRRRRHSPAQR